MNRSSAILDARPALGTSAMLLNTLLIPIMGVAIKALTEAGVGTLEMLLTRSWLTLALLLPVLAWPEARRMVARADIRAHMVHAAFAMSTMACFYFSLRTLPIVTVTAINFTTPIFTLILARLIFKERVATLGWIAMAVGFAGTVLVLRPGAVGFGLDSVVVLLGSALAAGMNLAIRRMPGRSSTYAVLFYFTLFGALVYGALGAPRAELPGPAEWPWFFTLAAIALAVHTCNTLAYRFSSSVLVGALDYGRIVWAALIGVVLLAEIPDLIDALGIALIVASGLIVLRLSGRRAHDPA